MQVTFWGTRGSIASPGPDTMHFGGNTSCVEIRIGDDILIFDAGTGIRALGNALIRDRPRGLTANLFISHVHWDHIQGFPFFGPLFLPTTELRVFGPQEQHQRLSATMAGQMQYRYFPVDLDQLSARIEYQELGEERVALGRASVTGRYLNHTTLTMAYRVESGSGSVVYATDTEAFCQQPRAWSDTQKRRFFHRRDEELAQFFAGADLLILDSQYTSDEYHNHVGWGHGTYDYALDLAISAGVKKLAFFHHDPNRSDSQLQSIVGYCASRAQAEGAGLEVVGAAEQLRIDVGDDSTSDVARAVHSLPTLSSGARRPGGAGQRLETLAQQALHVTHFKVESFDTAAALETSEAREFRANVLLVPWARRGDVAQAVAEAKRHVRRRTVPVLAIVSKADPSSMSAAFAEGATDVLVEPLTAAQLRSRVDAWLFREGIALDRRREPRDEASAASVRPAEASGQK